MGNSNLNNNYDDLDDVDDRIFDVLDDDKSVYLQKKELEQRRNSFLNRSNKEFLHHLTEARETEYLKDYVGAYADMKIESFEERREVITMVINNLLNDTERGVIPKGKTLSVSKEWARSLLTALDKMNVYFENIGKEPDPHEEFKTTDLQGLFRTQFTKDDGVTPNKQGSLEQYAKHYRFINTIESLVFSTDRDYSSGLMTPQDLEKIGEINNYVEPPKSTQKWYKDDDFNKLEREILRRCGGDYSKCDDISIAILMSRKWGLRIDTTVQLTLDDIKAKDGFIRVPALKNKSAVPYKAITFDDDDGRKLLGAFVQRAMERGQDTLITASKDSLYRSFKRIEKKAGVETGLYKGQRFHALRRAFADELYNDNRKYEYYTDREGCKMLVNSALGHNYKELKNLSCYVIDMW